MTFRRVPIILSSAATACSAHAKNSAARCSTPMVSKHVSPQAQGYGLYKAMWLIASIAVLQGIYVIVQ